MNAMTQEERLFWLISELQNENPDWILHVDSKLLSKKELLRSLMNIRPPIPASKQFIDIQDAYLQGESQAKGITRVEELPPTPGHPNIFLWHGDITTLAVDSIVNAANNRLLGCFIPCHRCIDNAIHSAAGVQLRLDCNTLMANQEHEEPTGNAKITKAYNLPSRFVLHTVGPIIRSTVSELDKTLLASCYLSCLEVAESYQLGSIAFCCISTGEYRFPRKQAAEIAVKSVLSVMARTNHIQKVIFNVFSQEDYDLYHNELGKHQ